MSSFRQEEEYGPHVELIEQLGVRVEEKKPNVPMVKSHKDPTIKLPATIFIEDERGELSAYADYKDVELDPEEIAVFGVYEFKKFIRVEKISELKVTDE